MLADFSGPLTGTVSFADGETSATVTVAVAGDTAYEANETFTVTLSAPRRWGNDQRCSGNRHDYQ
jgi:hypothetical protein